MSRRSYAKKPLYRRVNRTTHRAPCGHGGEARWQRNTKTGKADDRSHTGMGPKHRHGLDYTPLFKFLLSKVGEDWSLVHSEAVSRLDKPDPIYWLVSKGPEHASAVVRIGESTYYSGLQVGEDNVLRKTAPELDPASIYPACPCCTHTFNGKTVPNLFDPERSGTIFQLIASH